MTSTLPKGEWITGGFWGAYEQWKLGSASVERGKPFTPDMRRVEEFSSNHPIFIRKFDNSEFAANRAALRAAGINPDAPQPREGVEFIRDGDGEFSGLMRGRGVICLC